MNETENLRARIAHLEDRLETIETAHSVEDESGQEWSVPDLLELGLTRRQAIKAIGALALYGGSIWAGIEYATRDAAAATDQVGTQSRPVDVFADSITTDEADIKREGQTLKSWAFDGQDADERLTNAISEANTADIILLENTTYSLDRTISNAESLVSKSTGADNIVPNNPVVDAQWTVTDQSSIVGIRFDGELVADRFGIMVESCRGQITVRSDFVRLYGLYAANVTFESGTSGGLIDASADTTVTDNGSNTVGDLS